MNHNKKALELHKKNKGKIEIKTKVSIKTKNDLSVIYTPGVAAVSQAIDKDKKKSWDFTNRKNTVAIITDGSAVLGLGNIGPEAAMPVMEGKAVIFKKFANIDAIPLCLNTLDEEEIIKLCKYIEPSFGALQLEDISSPRCFTILERLEKELAIPVFHDDQDGTAIVTTAALINACRTTNKVIRELKIIINGAGAAGISTARLLLKQKPADIILLDKSGAIYSGRKNLNPYKKQIANLTNKNKIAGGLEKVLHNADVFIGLSKGNLLNQQMIKSMKKDPIIFALANPIPEIMPKKAIKAGAAIVGTGSSNFYNQINNALVYPGIMRALLDYQSKRLTAEMKFSAAVSLAYIIKPAKNKILPDLFNKNVVKAITQALLKTNKIR